MRSVVTKRPRCILGKWWSCWIKLDNENTSTSEMPSPSLPPPSFFFPSSSLHPPLFFKILYHGLQDEVGQSLPPSIDVLRPANLHVSISQLLLLCGTPRRRPPGHIHWEKL